MFHKKRKDKESATKIFEFKLRPNQKFVQRAEQVLDHCRFLYNCALEQRISVYHYSGKGLYFLEQSKQLTQARAEFEWLANINRQIQNDVLKRIEKTFAAFFKRCAEKKAGLRKGKVGYPRFKAQHRYNSFSQAIEHVRGCPLDGDKLTVPGVGSVRVRLSRPISGTVKEVRILHKADGWYVHLVCAIPKQPPLPRTGLTTGIDLNLLNLATLSDGREIPNPRFLQQHLAKLKKAQRQLADKEIGSQNRNRARQKVARQHLHVARCRKDYHHNESTKLVQEFDALTFEDLNIQGMVKHRGFAKSILDAGWRQFRDLTAGKASSAGRQFKLRNPAYTSQACSRCGYRQKMPLGIRLFTCQRCEHELPRDQNAAVNIERESCRFHPHLHHRPS